MSLASQRQTALDQQRKDDAEKIKTVFKIGLGALIFAVHPTKPSPAEALMASRAFFDEADKQYPGWTLEP